MLSKSNLCICLILNPLLKRVVVLICAVTPNGEK